MKSRFFAIVAIMMLMIASTVFAQSVIDPTKLWERPVRHVGDWCAYWKTGWNIPEERYRSTVIAVSAEGYEIQVRSDFSGSFYYVRQDLDLNEVSSGNIKYSPHTVDYKFPAYPGQKLGGAYDYVDLGNSTQRGTSSTTADVVGEESISVAGGEFTALKISYLTFVIGTMADGAPGWGKMNKTVRFLRSGCLADTEIETHDRFGKLTSKSSTLLTGQKVN